MGIAPPERDPFVYDPVIFLAPARSHSSVVAAMVGAHPELYGFPELILFDFSIIGERLDAPPAIGKVPPGWNPVIGLERALAQLHVGKQGMEEIKEARLWLEARRSWTGAHVMDHLLGLIGPLRGVEKSPETVNGEDKLTRVAEAYPRARFIHLTRHPVTAQKSVQAYYGLFDHPIHCARGWLNQHRRIVQFCRTLEADRYLLVRSEDVLNDPQTHLRLIAGWLGIRTDAEALTSMMHPERSPYANTEVAGGNDLTFLQQPSPHPVELPPSLDPPLHWNMPEDLWSEIVSLAGELGYE
ncbi:MAG: sulfotransferase [Actinobacteria bacterium]|jgi:hypothetical protein|nr:sulfotransferase [Actinomycetota bacterium]